MSVDNADGNGPESRRHPRFYFKDGNTIFMLKSADHPDGILYRLHSGLLAHRATFFASLFALPRHMGCAQEILSEGTTDDNPIELPYGLVMVDFDHLLTYLFTGPSMYPNTEAFLVSVMKLSAMFEIADGMHYTIREFTLRGDGVHPALQFELARCFGIDDWLEPAFRRLMKMSIIDLDSSHVAQIGHSGYYWLTRSKTQIQELRTKIAFHVPPIVNSVDCDTPGTCGVAWTREWEERVRQLIHHPSQPISCLDLLDQLRNTHIPGLCDACQDLTVTWLWGAQSFTREERLVDEAVEALKLLQAEEPLRAALRASVEALRKSVGLKTA
ncbi:hypothetical protein C8F04DRAFT_1261153 [Mycena alexandri]|uniref:BTB domain-containing protein n=1 Tax=Mycena alexandri TaxID=1745969 RepID=A0AAD6STE3_9AGAR|nr:hypothetical protein C8F04DRAFT_1261153 [Mycena alexandri]